MPFDVKEVVLVGTGNVSWHLAKSLTKAGVHVTEIIGRNAEKAKEIADTINTGFTTDFASAQNIDGVYLLAVNDASITEVAKQIYKPRRILVHCAGGVNINNIIFDNNKAGVFYPILSFNKNIEIDISSAVICVDSNDSELTNALFQLGKKLSEHVYKVDDKQRLILNLAAVWANNFTNHMYVIAEEILQKHKMSLEMIMPLIEMSVQKIKRNSPFNTQTGPAKRGEEVVLQKHLELLKEEPEYASIYKLLSHSIKNKYLKQ